MKKILIAIISILILIILFFPCLFVKNASGNLTVKPLVKTIDLKISFIHSVQKTPVEELLEVKPFHKIRLYETKYQSFGVGLPFLEEEGDFYQDGNVYILKMNREFDNLTLRYGVGTKLTLDVDGELLAVYKEMNVGSKIEIFVAPYILGKLF